jgi:hypothetical protein
MSLWSLRTFPYYFSPLFSIRFRVFDGGWYWEETVSWYQANKITDLRIWKRQANQRSLVHFRHNLTVIFQNAICYYILQVLYLALSPCPHRCSNVIDRHYHENSASSRISARNEIARHRLMINIPVCSLTVFWGRPKSGYGRGEACRKWKIYPWWKVMSAVDRWTVLKIDLCRSWKCSCENLQGIHDHVVFFSAVGFWRLSGTWGQLFDVDILCVMFVQMALPLRLRTRNDHDVVLVVLFSRMDVRFGI